MNQAVRNMHTSKARYLMIAVIMLIGLTSGISPDTATASEVIETVEFSANTPEDSTNKVIASQGILDSSIEGITLWHDYGSFALYRVTDDALANLPANLRTKIDVLDGVDHMLSSGWNGNPMAATVRSALNADLLNAADGGGAALQLVQFVGPIKDEWLQAVENAGATPIQYIATYAYLLWADANARVELDKLVEVGDFLEASIPYPINFKVGPVIVQQTDPNEVMPVVIQMYQHAGSGVSEAAIQNLIVNQTSRWTPILNFQNLYATLRVGDMGEIANLPDVFWVDERLERERMDEVQGQIMAGSFNADQSGPSSPGYLTWLNSFGFSTTPADYPIVDVTDDGIGNGTVNSGDPTLHQFGDLTNPTRLSYVANCTNSANGEGVDGHGHINISIAGGYDTISGFPYVDPLGYQRGLGINPYGRFAGTRVFDPGFDLSACGGTDQGLIKSVQDNGALIATNSWGCSECAGSYDDSSQAFDAGTRDADPTEPGNQEMIFFFSAGNSGPRSGTVGTPGNGKNMITVGASENQRPSDEDGAWTDGCSIGPGGANNAMDVIIFSSRGPSPGSRVKPELVAPGTHIQGTASANAGYNGSGVCDQYHPSGQTVFAASSGTSHSTPAVAGTASLAYYWMENTYGITTPSPAVMKAYLIAHPNHLTGVSADDTLPSNSQGYGMPNMSSMFDDTGKLLLDQSVTFDNSGETWTWVGWVDDPTKPIRIVLAYTDAPGAIGTSPQVNDLNLAADVGSTAYLGNVFSGQWSIVGGSADPFNNYEAIFLPLGITGLIDITVTGFNIAGDGVPNSGDSTDQDFALVCYNCTQTPTFPLNVDKGGTGSGNVSSDPPGIDCGSSCTGMFNHGTEVTLTATADTGSTFDGWSGACTNTSGPCVVTMTEARQVTASFSENYYMLMVSTDGSGGGVVSSNPIGIDCGSTCMEIFTHGTVLTLVAVTDPGSTFNGWSGACNNPSGPCVVTMTEAREVTASFSKISYALMVSKEGNGSGIVSSDPGGIDCGSMCEGLFNHGTVVTLTATADSGSAFNGWSGACTNTSGTCEVAMSEAREVTATFETFLVYFPFIIR